MAIAIEASLFEPTGLTPLANSLAWIEGTLIGSAALAMCVLAVALVGFLALTGRRPIGQSVRVVLGCFVLLGAPMIAAGLLEGASTVSEQQSHFAPINAGGNPREGLPPSDYDPYAGASVRGE